MVIGSYTSIITLNANGVNAPTTRQIGWVDMKTRSTYMLSTRDAPWTYRHLQTESKGMGEGISCKWKSQESWSRNTHNRQSRL